MEKLEDNLYMDFNPMNRVLTFMSNSPVKLETVMYYIYNRMNRNQFVAQVILNNTDITFLYRRVLEETGAYENKVKRIIVFPYPGSGNRYIVLRAFHTGAVNAYSPFPHAGEILSAEELKERGYVRK